MKLIVRYWSSLLPEESSLPKPSLNPEKHHWVDYSVHPASKLGLHNALLAAHDRNEILAAHGGHYECAVFFVEGESTEKLSPESAESLFSSLPQGEVKWLTVHDFLLPHPTGDSPAPTMASKKPEAQLSLFEHVHTPYDDLDEKPHSLDIDV